MKLLSTIFLIATFFCIACSQSEEPKSEEIETALYKKIKFPNFSLDSAYIENGGLVLVLTDSSKALDVNSIKQRVGYIIGKKAINTIGKIQSNEVKVIANMPNRTSGNFEAKTDIQDITRLGAVYITPGCIEIGEYIFESSYMLTDIDSGFMPMLVNVEFARAKYGSPELAAKNAWAGIDAMETLNQYFFVCANGLDSNSSDLAESYRIVNEFIKNQTGDFPYHKDELDTLVDIIQRNRNKTEHEMVNLTNEGDTVYVIKINNQKNELGVYDLTIESPGTPMHGRKVQMELVSKYPSGNSREKHYKFGDTLLVHRFFENGKIAEKITLISSEWVELLLMDTNGIMYRKNLRLDNDSIDELRKVHFYENGKLETVGIRGGGNDSEYYGVWIKYGQNDTIEKYDYGWSGVKSVDEGTIWLHGEQIGKRFRNSNGDWKSEYN